MLSKEEFEYHCIQHGKLWQSHKKPKSPHPVSILPPDKQREILEAAMTLSSTSSGDKVHSHNSLAGVLLGEGVSVADELMASWLKNHAEFQYPFTALPLEGLVAWVEHQTASNGLSMGLLNCLRQHLPAISKRATDKAHRALMQRMAVALGLISDDVIPGPKDAWTAKALAWRDSLPQTDRATWEALLKLASTQKSSTPSKSFLKSAEKLVTTLPQFTMIMRDILEALGRDGPVGVNWRGYPTSRKNLLDDDYTDLLRPLIWLCAPYPTLSDSLRDASARCSTKIKGIGPLCAKIAAACANTLGRQSVKTAAQSLSILQSAVKHKSTRKALANAIASVSDKAGTGWSELEEQHVPDHGFATGHRIGACTVRLSYSPAGVPELSWHEDGAEPQKSAPISVQKNHPDELQEIKALLREVKKTHRAQVLRLEKLMCEGRDVPFEVWQRHYLNHPIVGALSRRLLWKFGSKLIHLTPTPDAQIARTLEGRAIIDSEGMPVRLWHPVELPINELEEWQKWALGNRLIQPFQQVLREVHRAEDGPEVTEDRRYDGELLHQGAFAALCRERGWLYRFHGSPEQLSPSIHYPRFNMRAVMNVTEEPDGKGRPILWLRISSIRFYVGDETIPLLSVPSVIYSEAMRDVGLFVSASKATNDSGWRDTIPGSELGG